jgi:hypothetical protein
LSNWEAYICSLSVTCTMSFQPQDNYKQIACKSAFLTTGSHAKQMAPDLTILGAKCSQNILQPIKERPLIR